MAVTVLSQASAFNPGSDLWIVANLESSQWSSKLDWYLNFQIVKSHRRHSAELSENLQSLLQQTGLASETPAYAGFPNNLMISSQMQLPNKWVVIIPWNQDLISWSLEIEKVWKQLNQPSLRVFLPPGFSMANLDKAWPNNSSVQDFTVVLD